jgi:hypothetical protein
VEGGTSVHDIEGFGHKTKTVHTNRMVNKKQLPDMSDFLGAWMLCRPSSNCMFAEHTMKHIVTPTFPLQSQYDAWQVEADLGISNKNRTMPIEPAQIELINEHVTTTLR